MTEEIKDTGDVPKAKAKGKKSVEEQLASYKKGAFKVKIDVQSSLNPVVESEFTPDSQVVEDVITSWSNQTYFGAVSNTGDPLEAVEYEAFVRRMFYLTIAKKLSLSLDPNASGRYGALLSSFAKAKFQIPAKVLEFVDGLGYIRTDEGAWRMNGQTALAMSYGFKAIMFGEVNAYGVEQGEIDNGDLVINAAVTDWRAILREWATAQVNTWAQRTPAYQWQFNGINIEIKPPVFVQGAAAYRVLTAAAANTVEKERALAILEVLEAGPLVGVPNGATVQALNVRRVKLVSVVSHDYPPLFGAYIDRVERPLMLSQMRVANYGPIGIMSQFGNLWQLGRYSTSGTVFTPSGLSGESQGLAYIFSGVNMMLYQATETHMITSSTMKVMELNQWASRGLKKF